MLKDTTPPTQKDKEKAMLACFNKYFTTAELVNWVTIAHGVIYKYKGRDNHSETKASGDASSFLQSFGDLINALIDKAPAVVKTQQIKEKLSHVFTYIDSEDVKAALAEIGCAFLRDQVELTYLPADTGKFLHQLACLADLSEMESEYDVFLEYSQP